MWSKPQQTCPLSHEEIVQRQKLANFLDTASEDDFTEKAIVPLFQRLGFPRVSPSGHTEKTLEFGKDLWMKYQLPTSHWIYFCAQVKKDKIDASGTGGNSNVATVLTQARMAIDHPIFDPEANRKVLLDHLFLISAGEITQAARMWLVEQLDAGQRRHIIFMDRDEFLDRLRTGGPSSLRQFMKCPKCSQEMELRFHKPSETAYLLKPYYFSEWDYCKACRHVQHYENYKVYNKDRSLTSAAAT